MLKKKKNVKYRNLGRSSLRTKICMTYFQVTKMRLKKAKYKLGKLEFLPFKNRYREFVP